MSRKSSVGLRLAEEAAGIIRVAPGPSEGILPDALRALPQETVQALDLALEAVIQQGSRRQAGRYVSRIGCQEAGAVGRYRYNDRVSAK